MKRVRTITPRLWRCWVKEDGKRNVVRITFSKPEWEELGFEIKPSESAFMWTLFGPNAGPVFANFQVQPVKKR
jgi:hypothetical protein